MRPKPIRPSHLRPEWYHRPRGLEDWLELGAFLVVCALLALVVWRG